MSEKTGNRVRTRIKVCGIRDHAAATVAADAGADAAIAKALARAGRALGIAFQIQDDLLDLIGVEDVVGKSLGKDLDKGKLTLPVIHHLAECEPQERAQSLALAMRAAEEDENEAPAELRRRLDTTGSIDHAQLVSERIVRTARGQLDAVPDSPAKRMLVAMADAVVQRAF